MGLFRLVSILCGVLVLSGCGQSALTEMRREIDRREHRIQQKQIELEELERRDRALREEKERLLSEMESRKMTLDQLSRSLERLQRENARYRSETLRREGDRERLDSELSSFQERIEALRKADDTPGDAEKRKRIEALREEIETYLRIGLD